MAEVDGGLGFGRVSVAISPACDGHGLAGETIGSGVGDSMAAVGDYSACSAWMWIYVVLTSSFTSALPPRSRQAEDMLVAFGVEHRAGVRGKGSHSLTDSPKKTRMDQY